MIEKRAVMPPGGPLFRPSRVNMSSMENYRKYAAGAADPVPYDTWRMVNEEFCKRIAREVISNRSGVALPHRLGTILVASTEPSRKPWRMSVNRTASMQEGVQVLEPNLATGGLVCKILYTTYNEKYYRPERQLWAFKGMRAFTRAVSAAYRVHWDRYMYLSPKSKVSGDFKKYKKKIFLAREARGYNPLEA